MDTPIRFLEAFSDIEVVEAPLAPIRSGQIKLETTATNS